jgi:hypothetical protein
MQKMKNRGTNLVDKIDDSPICAEENTHFSVIMKLESGGKRQAKGEKDE